MRLPWVDGAVAHGAVWLVVSVGKEPDRRKLARWAGGDNCESPTCDRVPGGCDVEGADGISPRLRPLVCFISSRMKRTATFLNHGLRSLINAIVRSELFLTK